MSAEVINLSRNIVITGDEFKHVQCDPNLTDEAVEGEETSTKGCRCSTKFNRNQCTVGLHTAVMHGGSAKIQNTRIERCGQRGKCIEWSLPGKMHLFFVRHYAHCPCKFSNVAQVLRENIAFIFTCSMIVQTVCLRRMQLKGAIREESSSTQLIHQPLKRTSFTTFAVLEFTLKTETRCIMI